MRRRALAAFSLSRRDPRENKRGRLRWQDDSTCPTQQGKRTHHRRKRRHRAPTGRSVSASKPEVRERKQEPLVCEKCLARSEGTRRAHAPCRGFPACAQRGTCKRHYSTRVDRGGAAPARLTGGEATRTPLIDMEAGRRKRLTRELRGTRQTKDEFRQRVPRIWPHKSGDYSGSGIAVGTPSDEFGRVSVCLGRFFR
jgi:hypothetical protein